MKRIVTVIVLAVGGLVAATALTLSALAVAGGDIGDVVHPRLDEQRTTRTQSVSNSPSPSDDRTPSETPSADDHGGASEPGDDHGGGDNSGSGSDNSGSGSDNSGSGSDNSGSGSDNSGSGSGHSDDD